MSTIKRAARGLISRAQKVSKEVSRKLEQGVKVEVGPVKARLAKDGLEIASSYTEGGERHAASLKVGHQDAGGWRVERTLIQTPEHAVDHLAVMERRQRYRMPLGHLGGLSGEQLARIERQASAVPQAAVPGPTGLTPQELKELELMLAAHVRQHPFGELLMDLGATEMEAHRAITAALGLRDGAGGGLCKRMELPLTRQMLQLQETLAHPDWSKLEADRSADAQSLTVLNGYQRPGLFALRLESYVNAMALDSCVYDELGVQAADLYLRAMTRLYEEGARTYPKGDLNLADPVALREAAYHGLNEADAYALLLLAEANPARARELGKAYFGARQSARAAIAREDAARRGEA